MQCFATLWIPELPLDILCLLKQAHLLCELVPPMTKECIIAHLLYFKWKLVPSPSDWVHNVVADFRSILKHEKSNIICHCEIMNIKGFRYTTDSQKDKDDVLKFVLRQVVFF
jgi:hypothetical protein